MQPTASQQQLPPGAEPPAPAHPVAFVCHFLFKAAALVFYILCEAINKGQFVTNFVICIVLLAADFWTVRGGGGWAAVAFGMRRCEGCVVRRRQAALGGPTLTEKYASSQPKRNTTNQPRQVKNVTGRLLVGLRWWNDASAGADGGTAWRFEALAEGQRAVNPAERRWFWGVLIAAPVLWALSALSAFFGLDWGELRAGGCRERVVGGRWLPVGVRSKELEAPSVAPRHHCHQHTNNALHTQHINTNTTQQPTCSSP